MGRMNISVRRFFYLLPRNFLRSFWGQNLLWHALAVGITSIIVLSGFDWVYFRATRPFPAFFVSAVILGWIVPIALPVVLYVAGRVKKDRNTVWTAFSTAQAAILGLIICYLYKAFTGRPSPNSGLMPVDNSKKFRFGFLKAKGIFPGWPSSHATIACSIAATVWILYPDSKTARYLALFYALFIGYGVSVSAHWFSDVIAGSIIGVVIGKTVGNSFKRLPATGKGNDQGSK